MRTIGYLLISYVFLGCMATVNKGDYVTYTSDEYIFMKDSFVDQSMDCIELGQMRQGGMDVKYCVGHNYAQQLVQGFVFEHAYGNVNERFIGARLSFKTKDGLVIPCNSETIDGKSAGKEYINCMLPQPTFDLYSFLVNSNDDVHGQFKAVIGDAKVYNGVIGREGKALLHQFYHDIAKNQKQKWKKRRL